ncbi:MAG: hypothetical protein AAB378_00725 [Patescibacteria group bacterium]
MAITFKKKYGLNQFCGYVQLRDSFEFLKSQKDIAYTKLLLEEDIQKQYESEPLDLNYIKYLEREYGIPNLWPFIDTDRIIRYNLLVREYPYDTPTYTHEEMMRILQVQAKAIIKFLKEERPNLIIFSVVGALSSLLLYYIAKKEGIRTLVIQRSRIGNKFSLTENYDDAGYLGKSFDEIQKDNAPDQTYIKQAEEFLNNFRDKPSPYSIAVTPKGRPTSRKKQFAFLAPGHLLKSIGWFLEVLRHYLSDKNRDDYSTIKPWYFLWDRIKRKTRVLRGFDDLYDAINLDEDFAFFPLQAVPEISTMLHSPFYMDQLWLIKQIARSLPLHYKLYVKEAPAMFGYRPRRYYKELKKIPNVKLINPTIISFDLIKNSKIVLTNTATSGLEALFFKKPVITFGHAFYNILPMVKRCRAIEDLPVMIREQLENFQHDEKALIYFIAALYKESVDVDLIQLWNVEGNAEMEKKERELIPLVDLIAEKIKLKPVT